MRYWSLLTLSLMSLNARAAAEGGKFIPLSPLTPAEVTELKEKLKKEGVWTDAMIEQRVKYEDNYHYGESDIVAAFPELRHDKKLSVCTNSMMSGATAIVYLSDAANNEVLVKSIRCSRAEKGIRCGEIERTKYYFLDSPANYFSLKNLTLDTARPIVEAYKANRIDGLPDWFQGRPEVRGIEALPDGHYKLLFGDYYCKGCAFSFSVRLDTGGNEPRLVDVTGAEGGCF